MIERLSEADRISAYDFLHFLLYRSKKKLSWAEIDQLNPDADLLTQEEKRQLEAPEEYITIEQAKQDYDI